MSETTNKKSNWRHEFRNLKKKQEREEFADWTEEDFIGHILELRSELKELDERHTSLKNEKKLPSKQEEMKTSLDEFKQEWPYSTKIVFLLTYENRPLTSKEIHNHLLKVDKNYRAYNDPKTTLSVYLRSIVKSGRIKAIKLPGIKEKLFALPELSR